MAKRPVVKIEVQMLDIGVEPRAEILGLEDAIKPGLKKPRLRIVRQDDEHHARESSDEQPTSPSPKLRPFLVITSENLDEAAKAGVVEAAASSRGQYVQVFSERDREKGIYRLSYTFDTTDAARGYLNALIERKLIDRAAAMRAFNKASTEYVLAIGGLHRR